MTPDPLSDTFHQRLDRERLRFLQELGEGANGTVHLVEDRLTGGRLALKTLRDASPRRLERFRREAELAASLRHDNVVPVHFTGLLDGRPCVAYEVVEGARTLDEAFRGAPLRRRIELLRDAARGLGHAHARGVVHRDVKPDNVVVTPEGRARLIDFGVAKDAFMSALTAPGQLVGTAEYMAPEQWTGAPLDARCDLFALGATLYHALTGQPPFAGDTLEELMDLATAGEVAPPSELAPGLPPDLERVTLHLLEATPRFRYARAERAAQDLDRVLRGEPPEGPPCLVELDGGARHPLLPGRHFLVGAAPGVASGWPPAGVHRRRRPHRRARPYCRPRPRCRRPRRSPTGGRRSASRRAGASPTATSPAATTSPSSSPSSRRRPRCGATSPGSRPRSRACASA
ncbi:MAG: serine/threonine protein kinase [Planctomycetota bacterium]|nr:serine/threonine protein kinase [Planctomycetota bacterium]